MSLLSLALPLLLAALGTSSINVALPALVQAFDTSMQSSQWVVLAFLCVLTTMSISMGRLGDALGRRRLLLLGTGFFTIAALAAGLASSVGVLIAARALQGLGAALMLALSLAFVSDIVPQEQTGRAMGLLGTVSALGTALGPSLGGILLAVLDWRLIFLLTVPLGLLALLLLHHYLPVDARPLHGGHLHFDGLGTALLALALCSYTLSMTLARSGFGPLNWSLLAAAGIFGALFVAYERQASQPLLQLALLSNRMLSAGLVMSLLVSTILMATLVVGPFYLSAALGLKPALLGAVMSVGPALVALSAWSAGRLVDRFGPANITRLGLAAITAGAALLAALPASLGVAGYLGPIAFITLGYALFQTANNTAVMQASRPDERGLVSGMLNLARSLGLVSGTAVMITLFVAAAGASELQGLTPAAAVAGTRAAFMLSTALGIVALVFALPGRGRIANTDA